MRMITELEATAADRLGAALADAMPIYAGLPEGHYGKWRPSPTRSREPWVSHVEAYAWNGDGFAAVASTFKRLSEQLSMAGETRQRAAAEIYTWGFSGRTFAPTAADVDQVVAFASALTHGGAADADAPVWNAYWTKVACAATYGADLRPNLTPQAIWDSRVATAVCWTLDRSSADTQDLAIARSVLKIPPARPKTGLKRRTFRADQRTAWMSCHAATSLSRRWKSQAFGSQLLAACARRLNVVGAGGRSDWTSFEVGAALFVEGY